MPSSESAEKRSRCQARQDGQTRARGSPRQRRLPPAHGSTFPAGQGRLCSFKSPPSQSTVSRKNLTRFFWWMLTDKLEQPVAFFIHFPHSPLGRLLMKEPIVPLQRSRQVGREQQWLREPCTAFAHLGKKKLQGRVPWGRDPHCRPSDSNSPSNRQPSPATTRGGRSGPHGLCEMTAAAEQLLAWPSLPQQDKVPPRGTAACPPQGAQQGHRRGFVACSWQCQGKELTPAPGTGEESQPAPYPPQGTGGPSPPSIPGLSLVSGRALLGKDRASLFQPRAAACVAQALNGRLYAAAALTSHTLETTNGSK